MSNPDDRFIAYVCDKGALTLEEIAARIGDTTQKADAILEWIRSRNSFAARRYAALAPSPNGAFTVTSKPGWRSEYLVRKGFIRPEDIELTNQTKASARRRVAARRRVGPAQSIDLAIEDCTNSAV